MLTFKPSLGTFAPKEKIETEFLSLNKPPADIADQEDDADAVEDRFKRRAIDLDPDIKADLEEELWYEIWDWKNSRSGLKTKLRELNDLYEGVTQVADFPWPGASSLHIPVAKIKAREIRSTINRNTMRPVPFLMAKYSGPDTAYEDSKDFIRQIEDFTEDKIRNETNIHSTLKDTLIPIIRDGTCPIQIMWETELERVMDRKVYDNPSDFLSDYASAEDAGVSEKQFGKILQKLSRGSSYDVEYEYDLITYDGPKAYLVPLIHFFHWPIYATELSSTLTHGKRVWYKDYEIENFYNKGKFADKEVVDLILKGVGDIHDDETLTISRDIIEGINRTNTTKTRAREYEFYELIHRVDLDGDGIKEKYLIDYHWKTRKICRIERYPIRKGVSNYFPLRLIKRDDRMLGMSLLEDISDLSMEIDILHRMRINSRTITHVPSFKAVASAKDKFDPSRPQFRFQPGVTFWLSDIKDVEMFDITPVDLSGSIEEENYLMQMVNLVTGADSGLSGAATPLDPRAPARKQQEMLRQSSNRIDDYVEALLGPFSQIGQFMLDLYYQYGPDRLKYFVEDKDGGFLQKEIQRTKLYDPNVKFLVNGTSIFMNPDMEFDRMQQVGQILATNPLTAQDPTVQGELLIRLLDSSRVKNPKSLIPAAAMQQAVTVQTPSGAVLPTEEDKKQAAKVAIAKTRAEGRAKEAQSARDHEIQMAMVNNAHEQSKASLGGHMAMLQAALEAQNQPQGAASGT